MKLAYLSSSLLSAHLDHALSHPEDAEVARAPVHDPVKEADAHVDAEVLDHDGEASRVEPHPRHLPAEGRSELDQIPEDSCEHTHRNGVSNYELHLHFLAKLQTKGVA